MPRKRSPATGPNRIPLPPIVTIQPPPVKYVWRSKKVKDEETGETTTIRYKIEVPTEKPSLAMRYMAVRLENL